MSTGGTLFNWAACELINDALAQYSNLPSLKNGQKLHNLLPNNNDVKTLQSLMCSRGFT